MRIPGRFFVQNLIDRRNLLYQLVLRDFEHRFVGSTGGWAWSLIHPLVQLASYTFVFQYCLKTEVPPGEGTQNYTIYLFCGYLPWLLFQETLTRSVNCLVEQANLITKTVFPSEIVPISVFLSSLLSHFVALILLLAVCLIWVGRVSGMVVLLPVYMLLTGFFAVGLGWIVSSLQVYVRDTAQAVSVVVTLWFWTTPIFITENLIPENMRFLVHWNPLAYVVRSYRDRLLTYRAPDMGELAALTAYALGAFFVGGMFFRHLKRGFADVL